MLQDWTLPPQNSLHSCSNYSCTITTSILQCGKWPRCVLLTIHLLSNTSKVMDCHKQCHQGVLNPPIICLPMLSLDFTGTNRVQTRPNHGWTRWIVREMKWECLWHRGHFCPSVTSRHSGKSGQWSSREENSIIGVISCTKKDCCDAGSD